MTDPLDLTQLAHGAATLGLRLSPGQLAQFARYQALLLDWNQRLNLTAIREPAAIQARHFLDSLSCATVTGDLSGRRLIDIGTGAGFPGLPLKILYPGLTLTLVESIAKKARFLSAVVGELGLADVTIIPDRAENIGHLPAHRDSYDWAVARAVAALPVLAEYLLPFCRTGGWLLAQKGPGAQAELQEARKAIAQLGGGEAMLHDVAVPGLAETRILVVIQKVGPTPDDYPRRPGLPTRRPL